MGHTNWCGTAVLICEKLPEDGIVRPKYVAIKFDFKEILNLWRDCETFVLY
jgi:hypothetical protein